MRQEVALPPQWRCLEGKVHFVAQRTPTEYTCSCPRCGGDVHYDGSWPDRCVLFVDSHPLLWCRRCAIVAYPDQFGDKSYAQPTADELAKWHKELEAREEARRRSAERALEHLRNAKLWRRYYEALTPESRDYWAKRGIPFEYQDRWQLGWCDDFMYKCGGEDYVSPTATIPVFGPHAQPLNLKHRLLYPHFPNDKYRYELHGVPGPLYRCNPELEMTGPALVIEGEIKAMVTYVTLGNEKANVIGLPGATPAHETVKQLCQCERVLLVMDPGARDQAWRITGDIGRKKCKVLIPPMKLDDGILAAQMTAAELRSLLKTAVPAEA